MTATMTPYRPLQSPQVWVYISDQNRARKYNLSGTAYNVGIAIPTMPPIVELAGPVRLLGMDGTPDTWSVAGMGGGSNVAASNRYSR